MTTHHFTTHTFSSLVPGLRLLVTGAVHGNEKCGPKAIGRFMPRLESGAVTLQKGSVTFIPVCNLQAYEKNVRFIDENLNRDLRPKENPQTYEAQIGNLLCPYLRACDVLLDIHSYHSGGEAFICTGVPSEKQAAFAWALGPRLAIGGWEEAYQRNPITKATAHFAIGTTEYARAHGAIAVTLECGQHDDPASIEVAYAAIGRTLAHLGMIDAAHATPLPPNPPPVLQIMFEEIYFKQEPGEFTKKWEHLDQVKKGTIIARTASGKELTVPDDGYLIMPKHKCDIGQEWVYWGRAV
jgi:uncharacterized protein